MDPDRQHSWNPLQLLMQNWVSLQGAWLRVSRKSTVTTFVMVSCIPESRNFLEHMSRADSLLYFIKKDLSTGRHGLLAV